MLTRFRIVLIITFLLTSSFGFAQSEQQALQLYEAGVKKFQEANYKSADSLFTLSLEQYFTAKTFFGRGAARYNISNVRGYCADMSMASYYGDEEAKKQFAGKCVIIDTLLNDTKSSRAKMSKKVVFQVLTRGIYDDIVKIKPYDKKGDVMAEYFTFKRDTTFTLMKTEEDNPYPLQGYNALTTYFANELNYPKQAKDNKVSGVVLIECIVKKNGQVNKIKVGRGIGYGCDEEALRLVESMGKWKNGTFLGKPVKSLVELPIEFNLN
ncbi:MAG: energy transducer TonB [Flavobacteriales bacterium]|nr:energy transducer TonB [Flavobacteriales bacterium]